MRTFLLAFCLLVPSLAHADEFYEGAFVVDQTPITLDLISVIAERPRGKVSRRTERDLERYLEQVQNPMPRLNAINWWDRDNMRMGYDERLRTIAIGGYERLFPARLARRFREIDLGFAHIYPDDHGPDFKMGRTRLRLRYYRGGPAIELKMPWPTRH